jgi:ribonuclease-3 family protein
MFEKGKLTEIEARQISPIVLAFVGDAVYNLYVKEKLVLTGGGKASDFQRSAARVVSAHEQSAFVERLLPRFTEEETEIFRRGRNAKKPTRSKNADPLEYNRSTGFEAVIGYLYLVGKTDRIKELLEADDPSSYALAPVAKEYKP